MLLSQFLPAQRTPAEAASNELAFVAEAVAHYCATRCPLKTNEGSCRMLTWRESAHHLGALEKVCSLRSVDR
jgi:hypothetical protein